jgi:uncharacterized protein (DUF302 family)
MTSYGFTKVVALPFETVKDMAIQALKNEGFGILTQIDVREKFK